MGTEPPAHTPQLEPSADKTSPKAHPTVVGATLPVGNVDARVNVANVGARVISRNASGDSDGLLLNFGSFWRQHAVFPDSRDHHSVGVAAQTHARVPNTQWRLVYLSGGGSAAGMADGAVVGEAEGTLVSECRESGHNNRSQSLILASTLKEANDNTHRSNFHW